MFSFTVCKNLMVFCTTGRYDEINKLLGDFSQNEAGLQQLMGNNRAEHERKLKEKLARRQKRIEQGKYSCSWKLLHFYISCFLGFFGGFFVCFFYLKF